MGMDIILLCGLLVIAGIFYIFIELLPKNNFRKMVLKLARIGAIIVFILVIVFIFVIGFTGVEPPHGPSAAYHTIKDEFQYAVNAYASTHNGSLPVFNGTYTNANCSACSVINISALLSANGGMFYRTPDSCNLSSTGNDNCSGNASLGCSPDASYIWIVDANGNVFSYCAGAGCSTNNSGYQDIWP